MVERLYINTNYKIERQDINTLLNNQKSNLKDVKDVKDIVNVKKKKNIELRQYLLDCYKLIITSDKYNLKFQLPCGTGKSLIMMYIIKEYLKICKKDKFVIFCPWIDLGKQLFNDCQNYSDIKVKFIGNGEELGETNPDLLYLYLFKL